MRKLLIGLFVLVVVVGGVWYGKKVVTGELSNKVAVALNSQSGKQVLNEVLKSKGVKAGLSSIESTGASKSALAGASQRGTANVGSTHFANEQQAIQFAMSRVSATQLLAWANDYRNRSSLNEAQKKKIESQVLSKFSVGELQAMANAIGK